MNTDNNTYYFAFRKKHELYGYWVEITGAITQEQAVDAFSKRYSHRRVCVIHPSKLKFHPKGCLEKLYLPLPEDISIYNDDPFFSPPKPRDNYLWTMIGHSGTGKSSFASKMAIQWMQNNPGKKIIAFDPLNKISK